MTGASIYILLLFNASNRPEGAWGAMFGWFAVAFFGLGVCLSLALLARPQTLLLDSAGFTLAGGLNLKPQKTAWRHVERFFVNHEGFLSPGTVGLRYRGLPGERILSGAWELPTREMVARLNSYRARALAFAGDPNDLHVVLDRRVSDRTSKWKIRSSSGRSATSHQPAKSLSCCCWVACSSPGLFSLPAPLAFLPSFFWPFLS